MVKVVGALGKRDDGREGDIEGAGHGGGGMTRGEGRIYYILYRPKFITK